MARAQLDDAFSQPSFALGATFLLLAVVWGLDGYLMGSPDLSSSVLLFLSGVAVAITPDNSHVPERMGCKLTPVTGGVCFITRVLVADCAQIYTVSAAAFYCAVALWNSVPRIGVSLGESSEFVRESLLSVAWPTFVITKNARIRITSGGVESKSEMVECDESLNDGTIQIRTKIGDPENIVAGIQKLYMEGRLSTSN